MRRFNLNALGLLWGALALLIFAYMETLINLTIAVAIASVVVLVVYVVMLGTSKTDAEIDDDELRTQILLWTDGIKRLNRAAKVDQAFGEKNLHATKTELAELAKDYKIEKIK